MESWFNRLSVLQVPWYSSVILVFGLLFLFYVLEWRARRLPRSVDVVSAYMLRLNYSSIAWFLVLVCISGLLGYFLPFREGNSREWFVDGYGALVTLNFTVFVPLLVGAYFALIKTVHEVFDQQNWARFTFEYDDSLTRFRELVFSSRVRLFVQILLAGLAIASTYAALLAIVSTECGNPSPWMVVLPDCSEAPANGVRARQTLVGALYYSLRGFYAYLALGLVVFAVSLRVFLGCLVVRDASQLLNRSFTPNRKLQELATNTAFCALLGTLVVVTHCVSLLFEVEGLEGEQEVLTFLDRTTFVAWAFVTFIATCALGSSVFWLQERINKGFAAKKEESLGTAFLAYESAAPGEEASVRAETLKTAKEYFDSISPMVLPRRGVVLVLAAFAGQALNIAFLVGQVISAYSKQ